MNQQTPSQPLQNVSPNVSSNFPPQPQAQNNTYPIIYFLILIAIIIAIYFANMYPIVLFGIGGLIPAIIVLVLTGKNRAGRFALYSAMTGMAIIITMFFALLSGNFIDKNLLKDDTSSGIVNFVAQITLIASFVYGFILSFSFDDVKNSLSKIIRYGSLIFLVLEFVLIFIILIK